MNAIGFIRSLDTLLVSSSILLFIILIVYAAFVIMQKLHKDDFDYEIQFGTHAIFVSSIILLFLIVSFKITLLSISNRIDREDIDRSEIFQQAESNKSQAK